MEVDLSPSRVVANVRMYEIPQNPAQHGRHGGRRLRKRRFVRCVSVTRASAVGFLGWRLGRVRRAGPGTQPASGQMTDSRQPGDKSLGMDAPITRRDFLGSTLLGCGGALLSERAPAERVAAADEFTGYGGVGDYAGSNGNT